MLNYNHRHAALLSALQKLLVTDALEENTNGRKAFSCAMLWCRTGFLIKLALKKPGNIGDL